MHALTRRRAGLALAALVWMVPRFATAAPPPSAPSSGPAPVQAPLKVVLLPSEIKIFIIAVYSMDEDPNLSARMTSRTDAVLRQALSSSPVFSLSAMPALTADEQATLNEHIALCKLEAKDAESLDEMGGDWQRVLDDFDYTLGPGLRFLKQRSGADYGLMVFGGDGESTSGNALKTFMIGGVKGQNYLFAALIDLATGDIVWLHRDTHDADNFTSKDNMDQFVLELLKDYPDGALHDFHAVQ